MSSYLLELKRWNVKNDGSDAVNTSKGINAAFLWASKQNYTELVLPKGTYLIDETNPLIPQSFMTFNLGGATLRIRDNSLPSYAIISLKANQINVRITNGKLEGDRYTHNYGSGGTHEFGMGIELKNKLQMIEIDHLEICNTTGDAIIALTSYGGINDTIQTFIKNVEPGSVNVSNGTLEANMGRIRTKEAIPIVPDMIAVGFFGLFGDSYGGVGSEITTDMYDVIFYTSNASFLSAVTNVHFFDTVTLPTGASFARVVLHQATLPSPSGNTLTIRTPEFSSHCSVELCHIHHCRRQGVSICGARYFTVRNCHIHHISGTAPEAAIDVEDGYDINQFIYIDQNNVYNNNYSFVAVAGRHLSLTNNRFVGGVFTINSEVDQACVTNNYFINTSTLLSGECQFSTNHLDNCRVQLMDTKPASINHCRFYNSPINFNKTKAYSSQLTSSTFLFDAEFSNVTPNLGSPLIFSIEPQIIADCTFEGNGIEAFTAAPPAAHDWQLTNVSFINIKHREGRLTGLPAGTYNGCRFVNCGTLTYGTNPASRLIFNNCFFQWSGYDLFYLDAPIALLRLAHCLFVSNTASKALTSQVIGGRMEITNNEFIYTLTNGTTPILDLWAQFSATQVVITNNTFTSNLPITAILATLISPTTPLIFKDNILNKTVSKLASQHVKMNNIVDQVLLP
ncbi:hypothetical protein A374_03199 [Fictibacillus macauensis ZFHKF-1]|uniref:Right handed beta helix domain-containing protein n=1 Tax=Fictibacillus macauensis ZFHKF-1 TaxID=1196324 RepID=I8ALP5_9BACL|nr:right-handed parallel beta-helix repeat-containing protein [Fictibacillus macauensis]EIT86544.1 hypothetical protein A374_03199 [Fictibacillus macauensis ZFHKF-1]